MLHMDVGLRACIWWKTQALGLSGCGEELGRSFWWALKGMITKPLKKTPVLVQHKEF